MPIRSDLKHPKALRCISNFPTGSQNDSPKLSDTSTLHQRKGHATPSGVKPSTPLGGGGNSTRQGRTSPWSRLCQCGSSFTQCFSRISKRTSFKNKNSCISKVKAQFCSASHPIVRVILACDVKTLLGMCATATASKNWCILPISTLVVCRNKLLETTTKRTQGLSAFLVN